MGAVGEEPFTRLAHAPAPALDRLALALAAEFRAVDASAALDRLDELGEELAAEAAAAAGDPAAEAAACRLVLGERHGFAGRRADYDNPENSMLDLVLARRRGLPILLSIVYAETARRAGLDVAGVGLPGHFVVAHFGSDPPLLLDPFTGGGPLPPALRPGHVRRWGPHETATRMLNNLVSAYGRRAHLGPAIRAAELRLALPAPAAAREGQELELRGLRARLN